MGTKPVESPQIDWTAVHNRLDRLGATCLQRQKLSTNGWRITCLLPTNQQRWSHRIDAQAASEAEAVRLLLAKAEEWAGGR